MEPQKYIGKRLCYLVECTTCQAKIYKANCEILRGQKRNNKFFCDRTCLGKQKASKKSVVCAHCRATFWKFPNQIRKTKNNFCSKSCAGTYNNKHKSHGIRRSKLEFYIESKLRTEFPSIGFLYNSKAVIDSELDIYCPKAQCAVQINGIMHYQPIYGQDKLDNTMRLDEQKREKCKELGIHLLEVDCSLQKRFDEQSADVYWQTIRQFLWKVLDSN